MNGIVLKIALGLLILLVAGDVLLQIPGTMERLRPAPSISLIAPRTLLIRGAGTGVSGSFGVKDEEYQAAWTGCDDSVFDFEGQLPSIGKGPSGAVFVRLSGGSARVKASSSCAWSVTVASLGEVVSGRVEVIGVDPRKERHILPVFVAGDVGVTGSVDVFGGPVDVVVGH